MLQAKGIKAKVISYGYGGYSFLQSFLYYDKFLKAFKPDIIIYQHYTGNDYADLLRNDDRPTINLQNNKILEPYWINFRYNNKNTSYPKDSRFLHLVYNYFPKTKILIQNKIFRHNFKVNGFNTNKLAEFKKKIKDSKSPLLKEKYAYLSQFLQQYYLGTILGKQFYDVLDTKIKFSMQHLHSIILPETKVIFLSLPSATYLDRIPREYNLDHKELLLKNKLEPSSLKSFEDSCNHIFINNINKLTKFRYYDLYQTLSKQSRNDEIFDETMHINKKGRSLVALQMYNIVKESIN
jgi:hypothetical protein